MSGMGFIRVGHQVNTSAVKMLMFHTAPGVTNKKKLWLIQIHVQVKMLYLLVKTSSPPAENGNRIPDAKNLWWFQKHSSLYIYIYLFFSSWAGGIKKILQSDWFLERAEFSHPDRHSGRNPSSRSIVNYFRERIGGNRQSFAVFTLP